jgi:hypothetical protein
MDDSSWEINLDRNPPKFVLTGRQRNYLLTGDLGPYGEPDLDGWVSDKADRLTKRIQDLIDDVCLLYHGDYLEDSDGEHVFDVSDLEFRTQLVRDQPVIRTGQGSTDPASEFAFEVGSLLSMLAVDTPPTDIVWGVLLGLVGHPEGSFENERKTIDDILRQLETRHEERLFHAGTKVALDDADGFPELRETTNEILQKEGITPVPVLVDAVVQYHLDPASAPLNLNTDSYPIDTGQGGPPEQPSGEMTVMDWAETSIRSIVQTLLAETRLRDVEALCVDLRSDVRQINERVLFGTRAKDIFRHLPLSGSTDSFPANTYSSYDMRTGVLHRLTGQEEYPLWTTRPVVEEPEDDRWKLTPYGRLLYRTTFDTDGSTAWVYQVLLADNPLPTEDASTIRDVLDEWDW